MLSDSDKIGYARQLVANPLFQELIERKKARALTKWRSAQPSNDQARLEAWYEDRAWGEVEREVVTLATGEHAEQIEEAQP